MTTNNRDRGTFGKQDVGHIPVTTEDERHRARLTVVEKAASPADALVALGMLGLLDGAP
ncbi:hypothetical protein ACIRON_02905 [Nocardioides sp. NPDC101246]|uniref:hypothetical protein n=1 Tax=Nocardioides sp. NPDC101246 TaxID=3364336 RepID=UPI003804AAC3